MSWLNKYTIIEKEQLRESTQAHIDSKNRIDALTAEVEKLKEQKPVVVKVNQGSRVLNILILGVVVVIIVSVAYQAFRQ